MDSLINMEMSKEEAKEYTEPDISESPKYPWGLCITLNDDSLKKLGLDTRGFIYLTPMLKIIHE